MLRFSLPPLFHLSGQTYDDYFGGGYGYVFTLDERDPVLFFSPLLPLAGVLRASPPLCRDEQEVFFYSRTGFFRPLH